MIFDFGFLLWPSRCVQDRTSRLEWQGNTEDLAATTSRAHNFHPPLTMAEVYDCLVTVWFNSEISSCYFYINSKDVRDFRLQRACCSDLRRPHTLILAFSQKGEIDQLTVAFDAAFETSSVATATDTSTKARTAKRQVQVPLVTPGKELKDWAPSSGLKQAPTLVNTNGAPSCVQPDVINVDVD